jgi:hypothetical protein
MSLITTTTMSLKIFVWILSLQTLGCGLYAVGLPLDDKLKEEMIPIPSHDIILGSVGNDRSMFAELKLSNLKYKYLSSNGQVFNQAGPGRFEIAATLAVSTSGHNTGIDIIRRMTRYMPPKVFPELAKKGSFGMFTAKEAPTVFPEFKEHKDRPECKDICTGACEVTCTSDGRKFDSLAGVASSRGTSLVENTLCTPQEPYHHQYNVLLHEFAHVVHINALSPDYSKKIKNAFLNAKTKSIWDLKSYAMVNEYEYFAEAAGVFFNANRHPQSNGGMNSCGKPKGSFCSSETEGRAWLRRKDPQLFDALSFAFTNYRPTLLSGLAVCVKVL